MRFVFVVLVFNTFCVASDEFEVKPSVWGNDKWYGGYDVYKMNEYGIKERAAAIKPSVWGTKKWPGGYEVFEKTEATYDKSMAKAQASSWGVEKWYSGYKVVPTQTEMDLREDSYFKKILSSFFGRTP
jgi:hypothetical protein